MNHFLKLIPPQIHDYLSHKRQEKIKSIISKQIDDIANEYKQRNLTFVVHDRLDQLLNQYDESYVAFILQKSIEKKIAFCITNSLPQELVVKHIQKIDNQLFNMVSHDKVASTKTIKYLELGACLIDKYQGNEKEQNKLIYECNMSIFAFLFTPDGTFSTDYYNTSMIEKYKIPLNQEIFWQKANFQYSDYKRNSTSINQLKRVDEYLKAFNTKESEEVFQQYMEKFLNTFNPNRHNEFVLENIKLFENYKIEREKKHFDDNILAPKTEQIIKKKQKI